MAAGAGGGLDDARMKLLCSHGGRLVPRGPGGAPRYEGGETRVLVVPRSATFRDLAARLAEMAGGAEVREIRHRLADEGLEDVLVSVTCDEELAHMRDEYDRLRAARPAARFRVFVTTAAASAGGGICRKRASAGLPPLPPTIPRAQSEQALASRAQLQLRPAFPAPVAAVRRVQSAQEFAGACTHAQPSFHQKRRYPCARRDLCPPAPPLPRPMYAAAYMSKKVAPPHSVPVAKATGPGRMVSSGAVMERARSRNALAAMSSIKAY